jgi:uncharacterized protein YwgA
MPVTNKHKPAYPLKPPLEKNLKLLFDWDADGRREFAAKLTPAEMMLVLLNVGEVVGRIKLQKEMFLAYREVFTSELVMDPGFQPAKFGPFSRLVADIPAYLRVYGRIRVEPRGESHSTYVIAPEGRNQARTIEERPQIHELLPKLAYAKRQWNQLDTQGIIRYIYRRYPELATKTAVPSLRWQ